MLYISSNLAWGDPTLGSCFLRALCSIRCLVFQNLIVATIHPEVGAPLAPVNGGMPLFNRRVGRPDMPIPVAKGGNPQFEQMRLINQRIRRELDIRQEARRLLLQTELRQTVEKMIKDKPDLLCKKLRDGTPLERLIALQVIGRRRLPLHKELIDVLRDPDKMIRQTAHDALVRISRGTDLGPSAGASKRGLGRAVEKWRHWLDLQQSVKPPPATGLLAKSAAKPVRKQLEAIEFVAFHDDPDSRALSRKTMRLRDELIQAASADQKAILERLRDARGNDSTDALAQAIPKLSEEFQGEAREALTRRLTRLTAAVLRDKLQDDNLEVRCAAALACGRKVAKEHIPNLLQLLDDPEMDVVLSARVALTELTGEDFGPTRDVDPQGRVDAAEAWRKWWQERSAVR